MSRPSRRSSTAGDEVTVHRIEELWSLRHLRRLTVGVDDLDRPDLLASENLRALARLVVGESRRRILDLAPISTMLRLQDLFIAGHARGIEAVATLPALTSLGLSMQARSVGLEFVGGIASLRHLRLLLGGRDDLEELRHPQLASLEVTRVRGLARLTPAAFPRLAELSVEDQLQVRALDFTEANRELRYLRLVNCKGLAAVTGLGALPALEHLRVYRTALRLRDVLEAGLPSTVRIEAFHTGRADEDRGIRRELDRRGWAETSPRE
jgi:protein phosphatase 1 regulatory subunit 7